MDAHQIFDHVSAAMKKRPHRESGVPTLRGACPLCGGSDNATKCRVSLMGEYVLGHCYGCEAPSRDLLAAFGIEREPGHASVLPAAYIPPDPKPFILEPEPPPAHIPFASAIDYLADIQSEQGSGVVYTHPDGRKGKHHRWATANGGKGDAQPGHHRPRLVRSGMATAVPGSCRLHNRMRGRKGRGARYAGRAVRGVSPRRRRTHGQRRLHSGQRAERQNPPARADSWRRRPSRHTRCGRRDRGVDRRWYPSGHVATRRYHRLYVGPRSRLRPR